MVNVNENNLADYYKQVQTSGNLRTPAHAQRWSTAVLKTLGLNLDRGSKKALAKALPPALADDLTRTFWLLRFRDQNLSSHDFLVEVARRSGNTDAQFARQPTAAVFGRLKSTIPPEVNERVAKSLSPEVRQLWQGA